MKRDAFFTKNTDAAGRRLLREDYLEVNDWTFEHPDGTYCEVVEVGLAWAFLERPGLQLRAYRTSGLSAAERREIELFIIKKGLMKR